MIKLKKIIHPIAFSVNIDNKIRIIVILLLSLDDLGLQRYAKRAILFSDFFRGKVI